MGHEEVSVMLVSFIQGITNYWFLWYQGSYALQKENIEK